MMTLRGFVADSLDVVRMKKNVMITPGKLHLTFLKTILMTNMTMTTMTMMTLMTLG